MGKSSGKNPQYSERGMWEEREEQVPTLARGERSRVRRVPPENQRSSAENSRKPERGERTRTPERTKTSLQKSKEEMGA